SPCNRSGSTAESATLAAVATAVWMIFVLLSTPTCAFIPKYHCLPFFVWCISGSRCCSRFLVEVGACRMVASTIVPVVIRTLYSHRPPPLPRLGIMRRHQRAQLAQRHHLLHLLQKYGSPRLPRVLLKASHHRQGPLFHFSDTLTWAIMNLTRPPVFAIF